MKGLSYIIIALFISVSCSSANDDNLKKSQDLFYEFVLTDNDKFLDSSYMFFQKSNFEEIGFNNQNKDFVIQLHFYKRKYSELSELLKPSESLDSFEKETLTNTLDYFMAENDAIGLKSIEKNLTLYRDSLSKEDTDSTLYLDYFLNRMYLVGRDSAIVEVEGVKNSDKRFTNLFYDYILEEFIREYPSELLKEE